MKRYEKESLAKNFIIFFSLEIMLLTAIFIQAYHQELHNILDIVEHKMKLCSYSLDCPQYQFDFIPKNSRIQTDTLYGEPTPTTYFNVPTVKKYLLKISLSNEKYQELKSNVKYVLIKKFLIYALIIAIISFLLSLYTLWPLKKALRLNDEFIKDILHDINTPLSTILINFKLLKREYGNNRKIERIESGIDTILSMQNNLKTFLNSSKLQKEPLNIKFIIKIEDCIYNTNKDAFIRIIDNILSNAAKYNTDKGFVKIILIDNVITIEDSGVGIKNVKKIFERFYTESERGIGIGMHIVKKLCDSLGIKIYIKSRINVGTKVYLYLNG